MIQQMVWIKCVVIMAPASVQLSDFLLPHVGHQQGLIPKPLLSLLAASKDTPL